MAGISVAVAGHEVIADHETAGIGGDEPAFQADAVERWEEHILVRHAVLVRPPGNGSADGRRKEVGQAVDNLTESWFADMEQNRTPLASRGRVRIAMSIDEDLLRQADQEARRMGANPQPAFRDGGERFP